MFKLFLLLTLCLSPVLAKEAPPLSATQLQPLLEDIAIQKTPQDASDKFQKFMKEATNLGIVAMKKTGIKINPDKLRELQEDSSECIISSKEIFDAPLDID